MYNRILVPMDSSETLRSVVTQVAAISSGWKDCTITLLHVEIPVYNTSLGTGVMPMSDNLEALEQQEGRLILDKAAHWFGMYNVEPRVVLKRGDPAMEICRYAEEEHTDLIIVGKRDKALLEKLFLGSVSQKVVQNAPCHVLVLK